MNTPIQILMVPGILRSRAALQFTWHSALLPIMSIYTLDEKRNAFSLPQGTASRFIEVRLPGMKYAFVVSL